MHKIQQITLFFWGLVLISMCSFAQEFTIKKSPEEAAREKEMKAESEYLDFQKNFFEAIHQKASEDYNKAIEALENCKQIYPNDPGMNFEFAKNYLLLKEYENAIYFNEKVLKEKPKNIHVLEHLKKTYRLQKDLVSAIAIQKRIIAINPKKKEDLILLYIGNRQRNKAQKIYLELEKSHQIISNAAYYKRVLFPKNKFKKNIKVKKEVVNTKKQTKNIVKIKVNTKEKSKVLLTKNTQKTRKKVGSPKENTFIKANKNYALLKKLIVKADKRNNYKQMAEDCKKGLLYFPAQTYLYLMQGKAQNKLKEYQEALAVLQVGLDFVIDDKTTRINFYKELIKSHKGLGNRKDVQKMTDKLALLKG